MKYSRKHKIQLLKQIQSGQVSAKQVFTQPFAIWIQKGAAYRKAGSAAQLDIVQFMTYISNNPGAAAIVLPDNGRN